MAPTQRYLSLIAVVVFSAVAEHPFMSEHKLKQFAKDLRHDLSKLAPKAKVAPVAPTSSKASKPEPAVKPVAKQAVTKPSLTKKPAGESAEKKLSTYTRHNLKQFAKDLRRDLGKLTPKGKVAPSSEKTTKPMTSEHSESAKPAAKLVVKPEWDMHDRLPATDKALPVSAKTSKPTQTEHSQSAKPEAKPVVKPEPAMHGGKLDKVAPVSDKTTKPVKSDHSISAKSSARGGVKQDSVMHGNKEVPAKDHSVPVSHKTFKPVTSDHADAKPAAKPVEKPVAKLSAKDKVVPMSHKTMKAVNSDDAESSKPAVKPVAKRESHGHKDLPAKDKVVQTSHKNAQPVKGDLAKSAKPVAKPVAKSDTAMHDHKMERFAKDFRRDLSKVSVKGKALPGKTTEQVKVVPQSKASSPKVTASVKSAPVVAVAHATSKRTASTSQHDPALPSSPTSPADDAKPDSSAKPPPGLVPPSSVHSNQPSEHSAQTMVHSHGPKEEKTSRVMKEKLPTPVKENEAGEKVFAPSWQTHKYAHEFLKARTQADQCQCQFKGLCSCTAAMEFMDCMADACASGLCDCHAMQYQHACVDMATECDTLSFECSTEKAVCVSELESDLQDEKDRKLTEADKPPEEVYEELRDLKEKKCRLELALEDGWLNAKRQLADAETAIAERMTDLHARKVKTPEMHCEKHFEEWNDPNAPAEMESGATRAGLLGVAATLVVALAK